MLLGALAKTTYHQWRQHTENAERDRFAIVWACRSRCPRPNEGEFMRTSECECGNTLYFENTACLACGRTVGYLPDVRRMSALEASGVGRWRALATGTDYRMCDNYSRYDVCNWMIPAADDHQLCPACRLNHIIPDLREPDNLTLWYRIEGAKRRLLYTLYALHLPVVGRERDPGGGLAFEFLADEDNGDEFSNELTPRGHVVTGHRGGLITINIMEARHGAREEMREKMNERYRTLLGHFRHESGHYYWDRLVRDTPWVKRYRALFGDERETYDAALGRYYDSGPTPGWESGWISAYASAHPWEDWGETWAHYLHMVDTLETAQDFGFSLEGRRVKALAMPMQAAAGYETPAVFERLLDDWTRLTVALNALNRSMGLPDAYPFAIGGAVLEKLRFVHELVAASARD